MQQVAIIDTEKMLLEALRASGAGWHDRSEIAKKLGKNTLNPADVVVLNLLVQSGQIESALQPTRRPHIMRTVYRLKE